MGNRNVKSEHEQMVTKNMYFQWLLERLQFKRSTKEPQDIVYAVNNLVNRIATELGKVNESLKVYRVVNVGSMAEGTKIREPNEFDFLLVLEKLSYHGAVEMRRECSNGPGYGHVVIKNEWLKSQYSNFMSDGKLKSTQNSQISYLLHRVFRYEKGIRQAFQAALESVISSQRRNLLCQTETGSMVLKEGITCHGPAFSLSFCWTPSDKNSTYLEINVDLTPAIDVQLTEEIVKESDCYDWRFYWALKTLNRFMAVPCQRETSCGEGLCFRLSFTETEVQMLRASDQWHLQNPQVPNYLQVFNDAMREHHIKCYKVMKYFFEMKGEKPELFQSYALKTILLKHMCHCSRNENISLCFDEIIEDCLRIVSAESIVSIPSIFMISHDILHNKLVRATQSTLIKAISHLKSSLVKIGNSTNFKNVWITKPHSVIYRYTNFYTHHSLDILLDSIFDD